MASANRIGNPNVPTLHQLGLTTSEGRSAYLLQLGHNDGGDSGGSVTWLQDRLHALGFLAEIPRPGYFDRATQRAVMAFQRSRLGEVGGVGGDDGKVGVLTKAALERAAPGSASVEGLQRGGSVAQSQAMSVERSAPLFEQRSRVAQLPSPPAAEAPEDAAPPVRLRSPEALARHLELSGRRRQIAHLIHRAAQMAEISETSAQALADHFALGQPATPDRVPAMDATLTGSVLRWKAESPETFTPEAIEQWLGAAQRGAVTEPQLREQMNALGVELHQLGEQLDRAHPDGPMGDPRQTGDRRGGVSAEAIRGRLLRQRDAGSRELDLRIQMVLERHRRMLDAGDASAVEENASKMLSEPVPLPEVEIPAMPPPGKGETPTRPEPPERPGRPQSPEAVAPRPVEPSGPTVGPQDPPPLVLRPVEPPPLVLRPVEPPPLVLRPVEPDRGPTFPVIPPGEPPVRPVRPPQIVDVLPPPRLVVPGFPEGIIPGLPTGPLIPIDPTPARPEGPPRIPGGTVTPADPPGIPAGPVIPAPPFEIPRLDGVPTIAVPTPTGPRLHEGPLTVDPATPRRPR